MNKRTKIVASIGPASQSVATLTAMMRAGMDAARLNFSHGTHASHRKLHRAILEAQKRAKKNVAILADLQGPKIRIGEIDGELALSRGDKVELPVTLPGLGKNLKKGDKVLIDDGKHEAVYVEGKKNSITVEMKSRCVLVSHKGIAFPGVRFKAHDPFTKKDREDAKVALALGVDWIVVSFVEEAEDIERVRRFVKKHAKGTPPKIMAKVERHRAVKNIKQLLKVSDGIMLGRGDLALDIHMETLPIVQKDVVAASRAAGVPVIVATQMLDSMTTSRVPTRAEISDVGNAVIDHTDAVMLSSESAIGAHPALVVRMMSNIIREAERSIYDNVEPASVPLRSAADRLLFELANDAYDGELDYVVYDDSTFDHAHRLLRFRPEVPFLYVNNTNKELRAELLRWAIVPVKMPASTDLRRTQKLITALTKLGRLNKRKRVAILRKESKRLVVDRART